MKKYFFLLIIFSLFSLSFQAFSGKLDSTLQEQEKEMTKYELEDSEFILADLKNFAPADFFVKISDFSTTLINANFSTPNTPPPNYFC
jgi:hypothetical protein